MKLGLYIGKSYEARFLDLFGNVCVSQVSRPSVISTYFKYSNAVILHNKARQIDLKFKKWVTEDAFFRLYTTILGLCATDCWKVMRKEFADALSWEMITQA